MNQHFQEPSKNSLKKNGISILAISYFQFHPQRLTWNLKMMVSKRNLLFQQLILRFHVKLQGCRCWLRFFSQTIRLHEAFPSKTRLHKDAQASAVGGQPTTGMVLRE